MNRYIVIVACLPKGDYRINLTANSASNIKRSFLNIKFCLLVGIGGSIPSREQDIHLRDIVISLLTAIYLGVIQYNCSKENKDSNFKITGSLLLLP